MENEQIISKVQQGKICLDNSLTIENTPLSKVFEVNTLRAVRSKNILLQRFCKLCSFEEFFVRKA